VIYFSLVEEKLKYHIPVDREYGEYEEGLFFLPGNIIFNFVSIDFSEEQAMSCYFVAQIKINDHEEYSKYLAGADDVFRKYNGEYIAVESNPVVLEGEWRYSRIVIIRFEDEKELKRWYESLEYREILQHRLKAAACDTLMVKGLDN